MGSKFFPVSRIVSRNGQTWDYPGRTRGAEGRKKSGHMTAKNLVYDCGFTDGAKRIRTADPLHAMQVLLAPNRLILLRQRKSMKFLEQLLEQKRHSHPLSSNPLQQMGYRPFLSFDLNL